MKHLALLALMATPAAAQPWIDYDLLMTQHADRVVTTTDAGGLTTRHLDLGDGVTVTCAAGGCVGSDKKGAVGCLFGIYADVKAVDLVCPLPLDAAERQRLDAAYTLIGRFVAANAVPPRDWSALQGYADDLARGYRDLAAADAGLCARALAADDDFLPFARALTTPDQLVRLQDLNTALPRLPVLNPCL